MQLAILWRELKLCGGSNIVILINLLLHFHHFISLETAKHPEKWSLSFKNFFRKCECITSCYFIPNLLKKSFRETSLFMFTVIGVMEKMLCRLHISNYYFHSCEQNPWRLSVKKFNFGKKFSENLCNCIYLGLSPEIPEQLFWRTVPLVVPSSK